MRTALILGDDTRAFLASVRSLGRQGIAVDVVPSNWASPALESRYIRRAIRLPELSVDLVAWQSALIALLEQEQYDFILPCTDNMVVAMHMCRDRLPQSGMALVSPTAYEILFDKLNTRAIAKECAVPIARGMQLSSDINASGLIAALGLPLAIKARNSVFTRAPSQRHAVALCRSREQVEDALRRIEFPNDYFAEAFFHGRGLGVSVLACSGRVVQAFEHKRVNESLNGKGAYYRRSAKLDPVLLGYVERMVGKTELNGLAMFEFCQNAYTGEAILFEVNARPWGSLPLAVASGIDFPYLTYRLFVDGVVEPRIEPCVPVYCRNVIGDANSFVEALSAFSSGAGKAKVFANLLLRTFGLWRFVLGIDRVDVAAKDDLAPAKADWGQFWRNWRERLEPRISLYARWIRHKELCRFDAVMVSKPVRSVLMLCRGNICRSPYAEARLRAMLNQVGCDIEISSAGTLPRSGRETPAAGKSAAQRLGLDLSEHRSTYIGEIDLRSVDMVLHFDPVIEYELRRSMGNAIPLVFNLAYFIPEDQPMQTIQDPDGLSSEEFEDVYRIIDKALQGWVGRVGLNCQQG